MLKITDFKQYVSLASKGSNRLTMFEKVALQAWQRHQPQQCPVCGCQVWNPFPYEAQQIVHDVASCGGIVRQATPEPESPREVTAPAAIPHTDTFDPYLEHKIAVRNGAKLEFKECARWKPLTLKPEQADTYNWQQHAVANYRLAENNEPGVLETIGRIIEGIERLG